LDISKRAFGKPSVSAFRKRLILKAAVPVGCLFEKEVILDTTTIRNTTAFYVTSAGASG